MGSLPSPKAPSAIVKTGRWGLLLLGIMYGSSRNAYLKSKEDARRAQEEAERPAKEAAEKAERERKSQEEMAYLKSQVSGGGGGDTKKGGDDGGAGKGGDGGGSKGGGGAVIGGVGKPADSSIYSGFDGSGCKEHSKYCPCGCGAKRDT